MQQLGFCVGVIVAGLLSASAQTATPQDPVVEAHHHLILQNDRIRVFAVTIPAGEQAFVNHPHNFLTVTLHDAQTVMWVEGTTPGVAFPVHVGDTRFFLGGTATGTRNDSKTEYQNITVEFNDPRVTNYGYQGMTGGAPTYASTAMGPPPDEQSGFVHLLPLHTASIRDVRLRPGEKLEPLPRPAEELVIAVTELDLESGSGKDVKKQSGEVAWFPTGTSGLTNRGSGSARFIVVELL